ncbi:galactose-1-phosphate uridyl transferase [Dispira simplex]|nr:galactose-1-phosphate uridyl transferase [Dispira simplex]
MSSRFNISPVPAGPHQRYNPLTGGWVLCSPQRATRPWQGQEDPPDTEPKPTYDPTCYLCPDNPRKTQSSVPVKNPSYTSTFVFDNDFPAVLPHRVTESSETQAEESSTITLATPVRGTCKVICYSPRHDLSMAEMPVPDILRIVETWCDIMVELGRDTQLRYVQIFENKGSMMGCSNPHPHGQVWALDKVPQEPAHELARLREYNVKHGGKTALVSQQPCLLCDYIHAELSVTNTQRVRLVTENTAFACVVPYWALWPFETLVVTKSHVTRLQDLTPSQRYDLADILHNLTCRYDNLFRCAFPYSMGIHQAPCQPGPDNDYAHLHLHFYPPLLRNASIRKFLVGFEMLGQPQRDITAEEAAARLSACSEIHYKQATA